MWLAYSPGTQFRPPRPTITLYVSVARMQLVAIEMMKVYLDFSQYEEMTSPAALILYCIYFIFLSVILPRKPLEEIHHLQHSVKHTYNRDRGLLFLVDPHSPSPPKLLNAPFQPCPSSSLLCGDQSFHLLPCTPTRG